MVAIRLVGVSSISAQNVSCPRAEQEPQRATESDQYHCARFRNDGCETRNEACRVRWIGGGGSNAGNLVYTRETESNKSNWASKAGIDSPPKLRTSSKRLPAAGL